MRRSWLVCAILVCAVRTALADPAGMDAGVFKTTARFSVDGTTLSLTSAVATIEDRRGAPGYSWLRIYFYAFPPDADDVAGAKKGSVQSLERKWMSTASRPAEYNTTHAVIQLTVDRTRNVSQADLSVPGSTCTIAPFEKEVAAFARDYRFDGRKLHLKSKGSYLCDMAFMGLPNKTFDWDVNLDIPVFAKQN